MEKQAKFFYLMLGNMEISKIINNLKKLGIEITQDKLAGAISNLLNSYIYPRIIRGKMVTKKLIYDFLSENVQQMGELVSSSIKRGNLKIQVNLDPIIITKMKKLLSEEIVSEENDISDSEMLNALSKVTDDYIIRAIAYYPSVEITTDSIIEDLANETSLEMIKSSSKEDLNKEEKEDLNKEEKISNILDEAVKNSNKFADKSPIEYLKIHEYKDLDDARFDRKIKVFVDKLNDSIFLQDKFKKERDMVVDKLEKAKENLETAMKMFKQLYDKSNE